MSNPNSASSLPKATVLVEQLCNELIDTLPCDFVAVAVYNQQGNVLKWKRASGNRNDKYKRIVVRFGKGVAGQVIRSGRTMIVTSFPNDIEGVPTDYPIMLAENLVSSIAVPIFINRKPWGVLLAGNRQEQRFTPEQRDRMAVVASQISEIMI